MLTSALSLFFLELLALLYLRGCHEPATQIWNTAARSKEFRNFLKDPSIPKGEKDEGLQAVLKDLKVSEITQRFMGTGPVHWCTLLCIAVHYCP